MMATSVINDLWTKADKMNWFKGIRVMEITDEAVRPFVEKEITKFHCDITSNYIHRSLCGTCKSTNARQCASRICSAMTSQIESVHRFMHKSLPSYKHSDITKWLSDPWEIAKCYMSKSKDLEGKQVSDIDFPSVLNVVINNRRFEGLITAVDMTNDENIFCKGRNARNKVMHSRSHQITAQDLNHYCDIFIDIVNQIGTDKAEYVRKIEKVRDTPLSITAEDIVKLNELAARYQGMAEVAIKELKKEWREEIKKDSGKSLIPSFIHGCKECLCRLTTEHIQRQKPKRISKDDWTVEKFLSIIELLPHVENLSESHREMLFPSSGSHLELAQWDIHLYYFVLNIELHQPLDNRTLLFMKDAKTLRDKLLANRTGVERSELSNLCDYLDNPLKDDTLQIFEGERKLADMMHAIMVLQSWQRDEDMDNEAIYRRFQSEKDALFFQVLQSLHRRRSRFEKEIESARKEAAEEMIHDVATGDATGSYETEAEIKPYNAAEADIEKLKKMMTSPDQNKPVLNENAATHYFLEKTGCVIDKYIDGSIILKVSCPSLETLFGFWKGCTDGTVVEAMSKIRDACREYLGCDTLEFDIVLKKKEVNRCTNMIFGDLNSYYERSETPATDVDEHINEPGMKTRYEPYNDKTKGAFLEKSRVRPAHGNFVYMHEGTHPRVEGIDISELRLISEKSICRIQYPKGHGSGFRIGPPELRLILTASHVLEDILNYREPSIFDQHNDTTQGNNLDRSDVWCVFNHTTDEYKLEEKNKFYFETVIHFDDPETDTAILELKPNRLGTPIPHAFTRFCTPELTTPFYLIGHPAGGKKKSCLSEKIINLEDLTTNNHIRIVRSYCAVRRLICEASRDHRLDNPARWLFHVPDNFTKGASGCPGLVFNPPNSISVVTVLLRGYPDWFYGSNATWQEKANLPQDFRVEQGANMKCVFENLRKHKPILYNQILC